MKTTETLFPIVSFPHPSNLHSFLHPVVFSFLGKKRWSSFINGWPCKDLRADRRLNYNRSRTRLVSPGGTTVDRVTKCCKDDKSLDKIQCGRLLILGGPIWEDRRQVEILSYLN